MGAHIRIRERSIESSLADQATKGVTAPAVPAWGVPQNGDGSVSDRRAALPPLGLREYWFPLAPDRRMPRKRPLFWNMLGDELVLFRDEHGEVKAITDICPHRGASLAKGRCFYRGTIACPYHGAVFDGRGDCVAFITEGPDSKMVGNLPARAYPTATLKGWVFIWMGTSDPAPMEEDIPPEFFEPKSTYVQSTYTYWETSWIIALENQNDSHNAGLWVHRNSVVQIVSGRSRNRTPLGPRSKLVNDAALVPLRHNQSYYADESGRLPFQMYYPGVDGVWPRTKWRRRISRLFTPWRALQNNPIRKRYVGRIHENHSEEWIHGWHMPGMVRTSLSPHAMYTRWAVPVQANLSRMVYFHSRRVNNPISRAAVFVWHHAFYNWWAHYNFSGQDNRVASPCRYWTAENLSPSDSHLIQLRRLITERTRDAKLGRLQGFTGVTAAEELSFRLQKDLGREAEDSLDKADDPNLSVANRPRN